MEPGIRITSVARTVLAVLGLPGGGLDPAAAPSDERVKALAGGAPCAKLLIYAPDAIGQAAARLLDAEFRGLEARGFRKFSLRSVVPPKTPVCFASMFSGLLPERHGILKYEKPALKCRIIFDALPERGLRAAIAAVKDSSIDLIFRGRQADYFPGKDDAAVAARALELIAGGDHDCLLVYQQEYDDLLHALGPRAPDALAAARRHVKTFEALAEAFDRRWAGRPRAVLFAPDHGAHDDPAGGGTHGEDIPEDMDVFHLWKFSRD